MPDGRQMDKDRVNIYNGVSSHKKKNEILPSVTTWRNLDGIILSEMSQTEMNITQFYLYVGSKNQI